MPKENPDQTEQKCIRTGSSFLCAPEPKCSK